MQEADYRLIYQPGRRKWLLFGAPHHGYMRGSDYYTKEVAASLASKLDGSLVYAENMRPIVDLNKEPWRASNPRLEELCRSYQAYPLAPGVRLFIEIHSHIHGHYPLEISPGYLLKTALPFDQEFADRLALMQKVYSQLITALWQSRFPLPCPRAGVYPFNEKVVMKATKTYLFQRIRREQIAGRRLFGIHLEIYRDYKTGSCQGICYEMMMTLVRSLAESIRSGFFR